MSRRRNNDTPAWAGVVLVIMWIIIITVVIAGIVMAYYWGPARGPRRVSAQTENYICRNAALAEPVRMRPLA